MLAQAGSIASHPSLTYSALLRKEAFCTCVMGFGQDEEATSRSPAWRWWAVGTADMKWFEHDWTNDA